MIKRNIRTHRHKDTQRSVFFSLRYGGFFLAAYKRISLLGAVSGELGHVEYNTFILSQASNKQVSLPFLPWPPPKFVILSPDTEVRLGETMLYRLLYTVVWTY